MSVPRRSIMKLLCTFAFALSCLAQTSNTGPFDPANPVFPVLTITPLTDPAVPTVAQVGPRGAATWSYKVVGVLPNAAYHTAASAAGSVTIGNANLTVQQYNVISWSQVPGATSYDIYRTAVGTTPSTTGKLNTSPITTTFFADTGLAGNGSTAPATNTTGVVTGASIGTLPVGSVVSGSNLTLPGTLGIGTTAVDPATGITTPQSTIQNASSAYDSASLGSELTSSGCFSLGTGWSGTYAGGYVHTPGNTAALTCAMSTTNGATYQIGFTFARNAGSISVSIGGATYLTGLQNAGAVQNWQAAGAGANFVITPLTTYDGTISATSIKLLTPALPVQISKDSTGAVGGETRILTGPSVGVGFYNMFWGAGAGAHCTLCTGYLGIGYQSLANAVAPAVGSYQPNTCGGNLSCNQLTNGYLNTAWGSRNLLSLTIGIENTAMGNDNLEQLTTGSQNTSIGHDCLNSLTVGNGNTCAGGPALNLATTANYDSAFGLQSLQNLTTGRYASALGYDAGRFIANGSPLQTNWNSTFLGSNTRALADGDINEIVVGGGTNPTSGLGSNTAQIGNGDTTAMGAGPLKWSWGAGVPAATCTIGELYSNLSGGTSTTLYVCTATNTWTAK